jgi:hypothetical protein
VSNVKMIIAAEVMTSNDQSYLHALARQPISNQVDRTGQPDEMR